MIVYSTSMVILLKFTLPGIFSTVLTRCFCWNSPITGIFHSVSLWKIIDVREQCFLTKTLWYYIMFYSMNYLIKLIFWWMIVYSTNKVILLKFTLPRDFSHCYHSVYHCGCRWITSKLHPVYCREELYWQGHRSRCRVWNTPVITMVTQCFLVIHWCQTTVFSNKNTLIVLYHDLLC